MHIRAAIGGRYTNIVFDIPIPIVDWFWENLRKKMLEKQKINEELIKLKTARDIFEDAAKLQTEIAADCAKKYSELGELGELGELNKVVKKPRIRSRKKNSKKKSVYHLNGSNGDK